MPIEEAPKLAVPPNATIEQRVAALEDAWAKWRRTWAYSQENLDSDNVKRIFTDRTVFKSQDGRTAIEGPKLSMYGNSTTQERLSLGYSTVTGSSDFRFSLKNLAGVETVGIDSSGDAVFKGTIQAGTVIVSEDSTTVLADINTALEKAAAAQATADGKVVTMRSATAPYTATFTRGTAAYKQDGTLVASGQPRFETGKFGQAVMVEEGTQNLLTANQSSVETDTTGFSILGTATISRSTAKAWNGSASLKVSASAVGHGVRTYLGAPAATPGTAYTGSFYIAGDVGGERIAAQIQFFDASNNFLAEATAFLTITTSFARLTVTATAPAGTASVGLKAMCNQSGTCVFYIDGLQVEAEPYATSWTLGGTTRSPETLTTLKAGVFSDTEGSVQCYIQPWRSYGTNHQFIFDGGGAANKNLQVYIDAATGKPTLVYGTGSTEVTVTSSGAVVASGTWYDIGWKWSTDGVTLYVNGANVGNNATAPSLLLGDTQYWGSKADGTLQLDGLLDDMRGSLHARTDADFLADYTAGAPLSYDKWARLKMNFDGDLTVTAGAPGDVWIDTADNKLNRWGGSSWTATPFGPGALSVTQLSAISADMGTVTAGTITGSTISGNYITGSTIQGGQITGSSISGGQITGSTISGGTLTGSTISGNYITGSSIYGSYINASTINASAINAGTITGSTIVGGYINGSTISGGQITGSTITGGTIKSDDGRTQIASNNLVMYGASTAIEQLRMGYDASTGAFKFILRNAAGTPTVAISGAGNAEFSGTVTATTMTGLLTGSSITASHITASTLSANYITASSIYGSYINASTINASAITAGTITGSTIVGGYINGSTIYGGQITGSTIVGAMVRTQSSGPYLRMSSNSLACLTSGGIKDGLAIEGNGGWLRRYSNGYAYGLIGTNTTEGGMFVGDNNKVKIFSSSGIIINGKIAFFNGVPGSQQSVAPLSTAATLGGTIDKLNGLLTALRTYNLITT